MKYEFKDPRMAKIKRIACCDPGVSGAVSCLSNGAIESVHSMPLGELYGKTKKVWLPELVSMVRVLAPDVLVVEKVNPSAKQGAANAGSFMISYAFCLATGIALDVPVFTIPPAEWKGYYGLLNSKKIDSLKKAREIYSPTQAAFCKQYFKNLSCHDKAEATLIAKYFWDIKRYTRSMEDKLW